MPWNSNNIILTVVNAKTWFCCMFIDNNVHPRAYHARCTIIINL